MPSVPVYNYVQTKEQLVIDRDQRIQDRLGDLIRTRAPGINVATAIREFVLTSVDGIPGIAPELWREVAKLQGLRHRRRVPDHHQPRRPAHPGRTLPSGIADELHPIAETLLDELDRWLSLSEQPEQH